MELQWMEWQKQLDSEAKTKEINSQKELELLESRLNGEMGKLNKTIAQLQEKNEELKKEIKEQRSDAELLKRNHDRLSILIFRAEETIKSIKVTWDIRSIDSTDSDWIGLHKKEAENKHWVHYEYVNNNKKELLFAPPQVPGEYEFRYHCKQLPKEQVVARSETFIR